MFVLEPVCPLLAQRDMDRQVFLVLARPYPGVGARCCGVCLDNHAIGPVVGVGSGGESVQFEDGQCDDV